MLAGTLSASATPATTASASTAQSSTSSANTGPQPGGHGGATPVRSDEKSLSAALTATLRAKALQAVPGGTVYRVETDAGDASYEAHMTKADGSLVTVKFDKSLKVTKVESGMGTGDPKGHDPAVVVGHLSATTTAARRSPQRSSGITSRSNRSSPVVSYAAS